MSSSSGAWTTTRGRTAAAVPRADPAASRPRTTPRPEQVQECVIEALVVRRVPHRIRHRHSLLRRHSPHQRRLRHCVIVLGERHPHRPPGVVEPQSTALELPGRRATDPRIAVPRIGDPRIAVPNRAGTRRSLRPRPRRRRICRRRICRRRIPRRRPRFRLRLHLRSMPCSQLTGLTHAPMGRRLAQRGIAGWRRHLRQRLHQVQGQLARRQPLRQTRQRLQVRPRPHPLTGRRHAHAALPGDPGDHRDGAVPSPSLRAIELGDIGQLLALQRRDTPRPLDDPSRQLPRAGVATEVAARRAPPQQLPPRRPILFHKR